MKRDDVIREIQEKYRQVAQTLNERQRRYWAAAEAARLGRGGITIVCKALQMSPNTIKKGLHEIRAEGVQAHAHALARIRKSGGGRKAKNLSQRAVPRDGGNQ